VTAQAISIADQTNSLITLFLKFFTTYLKPDGKGLNDLFAFWVTVFIFREKANPNSKKPT
jgi:hypothetical protein